MNHKAHLLEQLYSATSGKLSYEEFNDRFYNYYVSSFPTDDLTDMDRNFFTEIQEKFEYTVLNPPQEDRKYGYISYSEFIEWLRGKLAVLST